MAENDSDDLVALIAELTDNTEEGNQGDADYPLPESKPVKFTNVDVVVMPKGYKSETPKPDSKPRFTDSLPPTMRLNVDDASETDGTLSVPVIVANSKHIYDYDGVKACKPFDELKAAAAFADGIPVTREHPPAGIVTDRRQVLGFFKNPVAENDMLKGILAITDKDLIGDVKEKRLSEVSPGFFCDLDSSKSGELDDGHYDAMQTNIFLNHVALTENGRCSIDDGCGVQNDAVKTTYPLPSDLIDKLKAAIERAKAMKDTSLLNMLKDLLKSVTAKKDSTKPDGDVTNLVAKAKDAMKQIAAERDALKNKLAEIVKMEKDSLITELTQLQTTKSKDDLNKLALDDLQKELDMVKALKANRLSVPDSSHGSGRNIIDEAYGKIGGK